MDRERIEHGDLHTTTTYQAGVVQASVNRILQKYCDEVLKNYGITRMQWFMVGTILDHGETGMRISDLAMQMSTTIPFLTTNLKLLASKKFITITENEEDSRSKIVKINKRSLKLCQKIELDLRNHLRETIYATVNPDDFRVYMKVLLHLRGSSDGS